MKALRFYAPKDVRVEDVPEPVCGPNEVKIKVKNCSTCGTDVKIFTNGHPNITGTTTMGHEVAGEVVEVGANARGGFRVGDRVQSIAAVPCGECYECKKGWMEVCQNQTSVGYQYDGGFAEYMIVPEQVLKVDGLNRIPDGVGYDEASAAEPFACAINAQEQVGIEEGDFVVVFGAGPIGCMHTRIARGVHRAGTIVLVDINAERLKMSADAVHPDVTVDASTEDVVARVLELTGGRGADVVITATPAPVGAVQAVEMARKGARIVQFGGMPKENSKPGVDMNLVHYKGLTIIGTTTFSPKHNRTALKLVESGRIPVKKLITHTFSLSDFVHGAELALEGKVLKGVFLP